MSSRLLGFRTAMDLWRRPGGWRRPVALLVVAGFLLAAAAVTYGSGGTKFVYLHLAYLPTVLAGYWFGPWGGVLAGSAAGFLMGPFMPIDVAADIPQRTSGWLFRAAFFVLVGGLTGQMSRLLNLRLDQINSSLHDLGQLYAHTLKAFASLVAYRDEDTAGHCERVAHNARVLGQELGLAPEQLNYLYWAGILHDLGKVATPTEILLKPGKLDDEEFDVIKKHASLGAELLLDVSADLEKIALGVRSHHERWDGTGYPDGLRGERIPLFGRILAVVDVFEALTSRRPYRGPLPAEEALSYLREGGGSHFDPDVLAAFERCYSRRTIFMAGDGTEAEHLDMPVMPPVNPELRADRLN